MSIQQIRYILAVNELNNFGLAAEKCFITQSTLSTMIAKFEAEVGIVIFDRKTKPVTITKEGEVLIQQLKIIDNELNNLEELIQNVKGELTGSLRIGVIPTIAPYILPLFLRDFAASLPNVNFLISEITTDRITNRLQSRDLDIGLVSIPLEQPELIEIPLYQEPFLLYDLKASPNTPLDVQSIDFDRLWLLEEGHCMRVQVESICGYHKRYQRNNSNLEYKSGTIDTLLKFVDSSNGVTLLPYLAAMELAPKQKRFLKKFPDPVPSRSIGLLVHRHFAKKRLLNLLRKEIQEKVTPLLIDAKPSKVIAPLRGA